MICQKENYEISKKASRRLNFKWLIVPLLFLIIVLSILFSISKGQADIPVKNVAEIIWYKIIGNEAALRDGVLQSNVNIVWFVRVPRVLLALIVGMGLAMCGAVMQALVQNPLADPYILGISSGASLGATFAIMIGFGGSMFFSQFGLAFGAFAGAMIASIAVLLIASVGGKMTSIKLILSGSVISALFSSLSSLIIYLASNSEGIKTVTFWTMGSLASASWEKLPILALVVLVIMFFFLSQTRILNVLLLGDETAGILGISLSVYRKGYMVLTSLLTGLIVAYSGMIGFVGLIVPHIVRGIVGSDYKINLPITILGGGLFLTWADLISRTIMKNTELPIGIITAVIGAPLFIYIIVKKQYQFGGA